MKAVITILEAEVEESQWPMLEKTYRNETVDVPESILQTFLLQSRSEPRRWQIVTHWRSQADLDKMRANVAVPVGVRIFRSVQAEPKLVLWDVRVRQSA
jgi:hypothetical protein